MVISGFSKLTLLDYPNKVACIIFTKGCNYKCPFCHNGPLVVGNEDEINEQVILDYLDRRKNILDGIVISGGEPLIHNDIKIFMRRVKEKGFKIKLDTNGTNPKLLKEIIDDNLVDYVAMDFKNIFEKYEQTVGVKNTNIENVKESIFILENSNVEHEFRTTIIKEFHTYDDIKEICNLVNSKTKYYIQNFQDGEGVIKKGLHGFTKEEIDELEKRLIKFPNVFIRGL